MFLYLYWNVSKEARLYSLFSNISIILDLTFGSSSPKFPKEAREIFLSLLLAKIALRASSGDLILPICAALVLHCFLCTYYLICENFMMSLLSEGNTLVSVSLASFKLNFSLSFFNVKKNISFSLTCTITALGTNNCLSPIDIAS